MNYIEKNYNSGLQIHDVASYLGLHPNYLSAVFKQETGKTPKQYMMELRIRKASELLRQTDYPILVISKSVGYADQLTFSRAFKSMTGMSPTDYRQQFL
ncbi:Arabinose operon regulatory protein [compost metagenome]